MTKLDLQNYVKNMVQEQIVENSDNISNLFSSLSENKEQQENFIKAISFSTELSVQLVMELLCQCELVHLDEVPELKGL